VAQTSTQADVRNDVGKLGLYDTSIEGTLRYVGLQEIREYEPRVSIRSVVVD
jgi:hypothetical protein